MASGSKKIKVCVACSAGGHFVQAEALKSVYSKYDYFYFTFKSGVSERLKKSYKVWAIPNISRKNPLSWIVCLAVSFYIALVERPKVIIATGAGIVVFFCFFAKLFGAKIIFMESMARVHSPTLTARILYPISDLFIVQWPQLKKFFPKAVYAGRVL